MDFQELSYHLEQYGCHLDILIDEGHLATNCISGHVCVIERLDHYTNPTLCHYCYELGIPAPASLAIEFERYRNLRDELAETIKVPKNSDGS